MDFAEGELDMPGGVSVESGMAEAVVDVVLSIVREGLPAVRLIIFYKIKRYAFQYLCFSI
jgi:hypothetical protein